jgi:aspartyl-tRNA(Asn)/glutamyl-tRNA(Gln) amidotransferase subunit A
MTDRPTLASLADDLAAGRTTSAQLVDACLAQIADPNGEGARVFIQVDAEGARAAAAAMDSLRRAKAAPSPYAGIPISVKDLFDIEGQQTRAGSRALDDQAPAKRSAPVVQRLRRAGFVIVGRTNMTEFAYSGIGINPHYGTPKGAWRRDIGHVPGGSSSGAAVSVADGMAHAALGTDTGGSCRIPAAFNGLVGYKPTQARIPLAGGVPLSFSLDSYGPIARSVACCAAFDAVLADEPARAISPRPVKGLRVMVPTTLVQDRLDPAVAMAFERALALLESAGAIVTRAAMPEFQTIAEVSGKGGFAASESFAWHRDLMQRRGTDYDPRVISRILRGEQQSAADYIDLLNARRDIIAAFDARVSPFDVVAMPTTANLPPTIAAMQDDDAFTAANLLALRNPTFINMIDGCAISLPIHRHGEAPVGLMLAASGGQDQKVFEIAAGVEALMQQGVVS